ncbi:MAG: acyl-CoA reductase [Burkholderiaceae bacterium]|nr:acyl-CoA reductase [Burkholderiaceae bacterium]
MLKREGAVIRIPDDVSIKITVLAGSLTKISNKPVEIFNESRVEFLAQLSRCLLAHQLGKTLPDVVTFAYWCRRANLMRLRAIYPYDHGLRMGLGLTFHICPANVPVNFAFSMVFGLLSGNTCVLRLPSKASATADVLVQTIKMLLNDPRHQALREVLALVQYERDDDISKFWMSEADGRIVWGGDSTVTHMRAFPCKPRSREVAFSDRYSFCVLNPVSILEMDERVFKQFCKDLFNDIYLMDQAACSSPQLIAWIGNELDSHQAQARLWPEIVQIVEQKHALQAVQVMDKFVQACRSALTGSHVQVIERHENLLYRVELAGLDPHQDTYRGYFGTLHEVVLPNLNDLAPIVNERYQTLTVQGIDNVFIKEWIVRHQLRGIDRVVPVGRALDMNIVWDGYDMVGSLSRLIEV